MNKRYLALHALTACAMIGTIQVNAVIPNTNVPTFAVEGIPSTGVITAPVTDGIIIEAGIKCAGVDGNNACIKIDQDETQSPFVQFLLPSGVTYTNDPTAVVVPVGALPNCFSDVKLVKSAGGKGNNYVNFSLNLDKNLAGLNTVTSTSCGNLIALYTKFDATTNIYYTELTGATSLLMPSSIKSSVSLNGFTDNPGMNTKTPVIGDLVKSDYVLQQNYIESWNPLTINVSDTVIGSRWIPIPGFGTDLNGKLGDIKVVNQDYWNADGTTKFTFKSPTATVNITGNFSGILNAYIRPDATACDSNMPAGGFSGIVDSTGTKIIFTNVQPTPLTFRSICLNIDPATQLLLDNPPGMIRVSTTQDTFSTPSQTGAANPAGIKYSGAGAQRVQFLSGDPTTYQSYVRVVNPTSMQAIVYAVIANDDGTIVSGKLDPDLKRNTSKNYGIADFTKALPTLNIKDTDHAAVTILSPTPVQVSNFIFNQATQTLTGIPRDGAYNK